MDKTKREVSRFEWDERTAPRLIRNEELICRDCRHRSEKSGICGKYPRASRAVYLAASAGAENTAPNQNKNTGGFPPAPRQGVGNLPCAVSGAYFSKSRYIRLG